MIINGDAKGFSGIIVFSKDLEYGWITSIHADSIDEWERVFGESHAFITSVDVDVTFDVDTTQAEIDALNKTIEQERAESQHRISIIQGRIKDLQSLTYQAGE